MRKLLASLALLLSLSAVAAAQDVPGRDIIYLQDGQAARPTRTFARDVDLGSYRIGANNEGFTAGGALRWDWNTTRLKLSSGYTLDFNTTSISEADVATIDAITCGTVAAGKVVCADSNKDVATLRHLTLSGTARFANNAGGIQIRNSIDTAYLTAIDIDGSNTLILNSSAATLTSAGFLITGSSIGSGGNMQAAAGSLIGFSGRSNATAPADGQLNLTNNAQSAGFGLDLSTDGLAAFRVRAQNAYADVAGLSYRAGTDPSATGSFRMPNNSGGLKARNAANGADLIVADIDASNTLILNSSAATLTSAGALLTGSSIGAGGNVQAAAASLLGFSGRSNITAPSDGVLTLYRNDQTTFSRLTFGGTNSTFPAIKRNSTALNFRLADDSADTSFTGATATLSGNLVLPVTTSSTGIIYAGSDRFIHNYGTDSHFTGIGAGNFTFTGTGRNLGNGYLSLGSLTTGHNNSTNGPLSGASLTTGYRNILNGSATLYLCQDCHDMVLSGTSAGYGFQNGSYQSVGIGNYVLSAASQLSWNMTCVGDSSCRLNETGISGVGIGRSALDAQVGANYIVGVGHQALFRNQNSHGHTAVGDASGLWVNGGEGGTFVGQLSGTYDDATANVSGLFPTYVGYKAAPSTASQLDYAGAIGAGARVGCSNCFVIGGTGATYGVNGGIGLTTPTARWHVVKNDLAATSTMGMFLQNDTAATGGVTVQRSPLFAIGGSGWDADNSVSRLYDWGFDVLPVTGNVVSGSFKLGYSLAGAARTFPYDFSETAFTSTVPVSVGASPSLTGSFRMPNNSGGLKARNAAGLADLIVVDIDGSNTLQMNSGAATLTSAGFLITGSSIGSGGNVQAAAASLLGFSGRSNITAPSDGVLTLYRNDQTTFSRLTLGGTNSSFPSIKRNGAALNFRLADDSADADVTAAAVTSSTSVTGTTSVITPLLRSTTAKVLIQGTGTGATQLSATQTTAPTCSSGCGTSPSVVGTDTFMKVTMGSTGTPTQAWVITFNGTWAAAPACGAFMGKAGMVAGKLPRTYETTTTTLTVTNNTTAPSVDDVVFVICGGLQ